MKSILNWRGESIEVATSKGGTLAVVNPADNLILTGTTLWPPSEIVQKLYQSRQVHAFEGHDLEAATHKMGFYSDLQSLHSEDAITWSVFGVVAYASQEIRCAFADALLNLLGIAASPARTAHIALWRRIPHPDTLVSGGPEIDVVLQTEQAIIFGEAKWRSGIGRAQGKERDKDQIALRREFFEKYGLAIYGKVPHYIVLGVSPQGGLLGNGETTLNQGKLSMRDLTWESVCGINSHPGAQELQKYLKWKVQNSKGV